MGLVYKFFTASKEEVALERIRQVVEQHSLFATPPKLFNDPFEFKVCMTDSAPEYRIRESYFKDNPTKSDEEYEDWKRQTLNPRGLNQLGMRIREQMLNTFGALCLTRNPENHLMWSHYGPDHRSFCAAFDEAVLQKIDGVKFSGQISYNKSFRKFNYFLDGLDAFVKTAFFSKSKFWNYEEEYRLVLDKQGVVNYPPEALKGIILGCRAFGGLRKYAQENLSNSQIWFEQMVESSKDYRLLRRPIQKDVYLITSHF